MKRVLFVDDESSVLAGLRRMLHPLRAEWDMAFVGGGHEALAAMEQRPFDVVVSDVRMPGMDGIQLLTEVRRRHPETVRIVLSGHAERESLLRSTGPAHQFLSKPCSPDQLRDVVRRTLALRALLGCERLAGVAARITTLPALPELYLEIRELLAQPEASIEAVGRVVARDVGMSAKVLQLVNSAFFGVPRRINSAVEATVYLGLETLAALVLTARVFETGGLDAHSRARLWTHSLRTGGFARTITQLEGLPAREADQAFLAGMLHEVGLLLLSGELRTELAAAWRMARRFRIPVHEAERRTIGASHAALGAYLLGIWGLPDPVIEAIAFQPTPSACPTERFSLVTAVHVATGLDAGPGGAALGERADEVDLGHLERLGLGARLPVWREACLALVAEGGPA